MTVVLAKDGKEALARFTEVPFRNELAGQTQFPSRLNSY